MNSFDIIGPVMVGPSSSHTAGAVRIGIIAGKLLGEPIREAKVYFHGSFLATGKGHGTDKALIAGLLGFAVDDERIPDSYAYAETAGMHFSIDPIDLGDVHPNSVRLQLTGVSGTTMQIDACSVGGGAIRVTGLDGIKVDFSGDYPTLIVRNQDSPGRLQAVTTLLGVCKINVATVQVLREGRGGNAIMVIECDQEVPEEVVTMLCQLEGILKVTRLSLL